MQRVTCHQETGAEGTLNSPSGKLRTTPVQIGAQKRASRALRPGRAQSMKVLESQRPEFESGTSTVSSWAGSVTP